MGKLQRTLGTVAFTHLREKLQRLHASRIMKLKLPGFVAALADINCAVAHRADGYAAAGILTEVADEIVGYETVVIS
jgi:hypothetical protein